jgi:putrescine aminotransferase
MNMVFYGGSGSDANDTIFRLVGYYWDLMGKPEKKTIIARKNAYHGSTVAGASLGGMGGMHEQGDLPISGHSSHRPALLVRRRHAIGHERG